MFLVLGVVSCPVGSFVEREIGVVCQHIRFKIFRRLCRPPPSLPLVVIENLQILLEMSFIDIF